MKRLSDYKGEEALEVMADIMEPLATIMADSEVRQLVVEDAKLRKESKGKKRIPYIKFVKPAIKNHKTEVLEIMARIEGVPLEEYTASVNLATLPITILMYINDPSLKSLFTLQDQNLEQGFSGPATEGTQAGGN